ncbi:GntR family transcriptional regulator [Amycolatopsis umgeniensis]|uniref:DNA-binding GntR family transcriptional regulator n=1 Tax=Amycolatopsis umgeniensis TaxID=336628 RepID=A0A841BEX3_9PSEU|nr:GntR family transcriptional regulator [Amycolatopsis umgeniensis]MBB5857451.1 DNA-binding GntR family transcriptional regulator [Amycolatopsis umgeniensis]
MASLNRGQAAPERIAAALRGELLEGVHPVGTRFREEVLAERFDVGRHTIRSALQLLTERGLVAHERHRGAVVAALSRRRIDEVFDYRKVLELGALRMALDRGADLSPVLAEVERLEELAARSPAPSWRELTGVHGAIHRAIVAAAGNRHLLDAFRRCEDEIRLLLTFVRPDFDAGRLAAVHRELVEKLRLGGETAADALTEDIDEGGRAALLAALRRAEESARLLGR